MSRVGKNKPIELRNLAETRQNLPTKRAGKKPGFFRRFVNQIKVTSRKIALFQKQPYLQNQELQLNAFLEKHVDQGRSRVMKYISLFADYAPNSLDVADLYFIMHQKNTGNDKMPSKIDKNKAKYVNQIVLTKKESLRDGSISRASTDLDTISSFKAQIEDNEDFSLKGIFIDLTGNKCSKETVKNFVTFLSTNKKLKHDTVERFFRTLIPSIKHTEAGTFKVVERGINMALESASSITEAQLQTFSTTIQGLITKEVKANNPDFIKQKLALLNLIEQFPKSTSDSLQIYFFENENSFSYNPQLNRPPT